MSAISTWAEGLPQPLVSQLIVLASSWEHTYNIYQLHKHGHNFGQPLTEPNLKKWLNCYDMKKPLSDESLEYFKPLFPDDLDSSFFDNLNDENAPPPSDSQMEAVFNNLTEIDASEAIPDVGPHIFPLEAMFTMFVCMPCLALHGKEPHEMLKEARTGDLEAMCKLIRIDRSVIFDSEVAKQIHEWALDFKTVHLKRIGDAFGKGLPIVSKKKIKLLFAQYVYDAAHHAGVPLTTPKIRQLFDAITQDLTGNPIATDPDLAKVCSDAFYHSLTRKKKPFTKQAHHRDK